MDVLCLLLGFVARLEGDPPMSGEGIAAGVEALQRALETAEMDATWHEANLGKVRKQWEKQQGYFEQAEQRLADARERVYEIRATLRELGEAPAGEPERS